MTRCIGMVRRVARDRRGAAALEFALIAMPLCMVLFGLTELGYRSYVVSVVEGTVHRAARLATVGDKTPTQIDDFVRGQLAVFSNNGTITIDKKSYYQFSNVDKIEPLKKDVNANGVLDSGDCYQDINNDNMRDDASKAGMGGSDDIVFYQVTLSYPRIIPLGGFFGWSDTETATAKTLMRNQPYGSQVVPPERCAP